MENVRDVHLLVLQVSFETLVHFKLFIFTCLLQQLWRHETWGKENFYVINICRTGLCKSWGQPPALARFNILIICNKLKGLSSAFQIFMVLISFPRGELFHEWSNFSNRFLQSPVEGITRYKLQNGNFSMQRSADL